MGSDREDALQWTHLKSKVPSSIAVGGSSERDATRFLNALRGFKPRENGAARVDVALSKENVAVYHDFSERVQFPFEAAFADVPGSESAQHNLAKYSSLLIFVGSFVSDSDVRVAREAHKHKIFAAFVHSGCDRELENDDIDIADPVAVKEYLAERRQHYAGNLRENKAEDLATLPLFFVSAGAVFALMTGASDEGIV